MLLQREGSHERGFSSYTGVLEWTGVMVMAVRLLPAKH